MTTNLIAFSSEENNVLQQLMNVEGKDHKSRLNQYVTWLLNTGRSWMKPDLAEYRDHLLQRLSPNSTKSHLSTIRRQYTRVLRTEAARNALYSLAKQTLKNPSLADMRAFVDEITLRLEHAVHPEETAVKVIVKQDIADSEHVRLTYNQANELLSAPNINTLRGLRDTAIMAVMLCTGIREGELCNLRVDDLRQRLGGQLALRVRKGKGAKQRMVPYGGQEWVLALVDKWLERAGIREGYVFRGFTPKGNKVKKRGLTTRTVERILQHYPMVIDGHLTYVRPHDLRRTYARRAYETGLDIEAIRQNLGHASQVTTQRYIGTLDADLRMPPSMYRFDLSRLI